MDIYDIVLLYYINLYNHSIHKEMVRTLLSAVTQPVTEAFARGLEMGKTGYFRGRLAILTNEDGLVEIVQNLIYLALDKELTDEILHQDCGIIAGFCRAQSTVFFGK